MSFCIRYRICPRPSSTWTRRAARSPLTPLPGIIGSVTSASGRAATTCSARAVGARLHPPSGLRRPWGWTAERAGTREVADLRHALSWAGAPAGVGHTAPDEAPRIIGVPMDQPLNCETVRQPATGRHVTCLPEVLR